MLPPHVWSNLPDCQVFTSNSFTVERIWKYVFFELYCFTFLLYLEVFYILFHATPYTQ